MGKKTAGRQARLSKTVVDTAKAEATTYFIWDVDLPGFALRVTPAGVKTFLVAYRVGGGGRAATKRQYTIGRYGILTPAQARSSAEKVLAAARLGEDPQGDRGKLRADITVAELVERYLRDGVGHKKTSTLSADRSRIRCHILPLLGSRMQASIQGPDIHAFREDIKNGKAAKRQKTGHRRLSNVRGGPGAATRTMGLLGAIFTFAQDQKLRPDNPVTGVYRFPDRRCERYLTETEMKRLGAAMQAREAAGHTLTPLRIIRLLLQCGARREEIEQLRWREVDFENRCLRLEDSKDGQKIVPLGATACAILRSIQHGGGSEYVFPSERKPGSFYQNTDTVLGHLCKAAALGHVRMHDLRHSFASLAAKDSDNLLVVGAMLGHRDPRTTMRYVHVEKSPAGKLSDKTAKRVEKAMAGALT